MIVGVTPARGGSKGLPGKNLLPVAGKPLLAWTVERALGARSLDRYLVSTEDADIAAVAHALGAEVLPRPPALATDRASTGAVLAHVAARIPACTVLVVLQATSPIRDADLIDHCVGRFRDAGLEAGRVDSLATGYWSAQEPYGERRGWDLPRQHRTRRFFDDGNVYVVRADLVRSGDRFGSRQIFVETSREQNVDIDEAFDLFVAEQILRRRGGSENVPSNLEIRATEEATPCAV